MRVLLTNHQLAIRAGSELYTRELATALVRRGHQVGVFTFVPGAVAEELRKSGTSIFTPDRREELARFAPDLVHVHHSPCLYFLAQLPLDAPAIFSALGPTTALESPPVIWDGVSLGVAVSEEVRESLARTRFGTSVPCHVVRNWFDDTGLTMPDRFERRPISKLVVITNHLDPAIAGALDEIASRRPGFAWTHWGWPQRSVQIDAAQLCAFDAVMTIGRTALLAAAAGVRCLLYDIHGCDGWLEAPRFPDLAARNFSGRTLASKPSRTELEDLLFVRSACVDVEATARYCWEHHALSDRCSELEDIYVVAAASGTRLGPIEREAYGRLGDVFRDAVNVARDDGYNAGRVEALTQANQRIARLEAALREAAQLGMLAERKLASFQAELDAMNAANRGTGRLTGSR